jgi:hypothetical protein
MSTQETTPPHSELVRVLKEHIWYELSRFVAQYKLLREAKKYRPALDKADVEDVEDALIVSFCTHARNVLEFFFRPDRTQYKYVLATDYADADYIRLDKKRPAIDRLYGQLCAQINHLCLDRTDKSHEKIGPKERDELCGIIHDEIERLLKHLQPGFDGGYFAFQGLAEAKRKSTIPSTGAAGATAGVEFVKSLPQATYTTAPVVSSDPVTILPLGGRSDPSRE